MKVKSRRLEMNHVVDNSRKAERSMQKSMRREKTHYPGSPSSWFSLVTVAAVFKEIFNFLFNNTTSCYYGDVANYGPVLPEYVRNNNSNKSWYKTHVPKFMREGLTHLEVTQLRQKVYAGQVRYV